MDGKLCLTDGDADRSQGAVVVVVVTRHFVPDGVGTGILAGGDGIAVGCVLTQSVLYLAVLCRTGAYQRLRAAVIGQCVCGGMSQQLRSRLIHGDRGLITGDCVVAIFDRTAISMSTRGQARKVQGAARPAGQITPDIAVLFLPLIGHRTAQGLMKLSRYRKGSRFAVGEGLALGLGGDLQCILEVGPGGHRIGGHGETVVLHSHARDRPAFKELSRRSGVSGQGNNIPQFFVGFTVVGGSIRCRAVREEQGVIHIAAHGSAHGSVHIDGALVGEIVICGQGGALGDQQVFPAVHFKGTVQGLIAVNAAVAVLKDDAAPVVFLTLICNTAGLDNGISRFGSCKAATVAYSS